MENDRVKPYSIENLKAARHISNWPLEIKNGGNFYCRPFVSPVIVVWILKKPMPPMPVETINILLRSRFKFWPSA